MKQPLHAIEEDANEFKIAAFFNHQRIVYTMHVLLKE